MLVLLGTLRTCKYEKKTKYLIDDDAEMEWSKLQSKETVESAQYEVETDAHLALDAAAPLAMDLTLAAQGQALFIVPKQLHPVKGSLVSNAHCSMHL